MKRLAIEIHPKLLAWLEALHEQGLHGVTLEETALRLIEEGIRNRVKDSELRLPDPYWRKRKA